jgi:hypothetical protein
MDPFREPKALPRKSHIFRKIILAGLVVYLMFSILAGIVIADLSLELHRRPLRHRQAMAATVRADFGAELQEVAITAADGVTLKGWFVYPHDYNGKG